MDVRHVQERADLPARLEFLRERREEQRRRDEEFQKIVDARKKAERDYDEGGDVVAVYKKEPMTSDLASNYEVEEFELSD